jgi:hypothetical protein
MSSSMMEADPFLGLFERGGDVPYLVIDDGDRPRWAFPVSPTNVLRSSMAVYTPGTAKAVAGWYGAGLAVGAGFGRLLPGRRSAVRLSHARTLSTIAACPDAHFAVASSFDGHRCVVGIIDGSGIPRAFAKIAWSDDEAAVDRFRTEAQVLEHVSGSLASVRIPRLLYIGSLGDHFALVVTAVPGKPGLHPSRLGPRRIDAATEIFSLRGPRTSLGEHLNMVVTDPAWAGRLRDVRGATEAIADLPLASGLVHGDFAPWNLLEDRGRVGIVDWEQARFAGLPFWDPWHFIVQAGSLARSSGALRAIREAIRGHGALAETLRRYAERCDVPAGISSDVLLVYLVETGIGLIKAASQGAVDARHALAFRARLLDEAMGVLT